MKKTSRRSFIQLSALAGAGVLFAPGRAWSFGQSPGLAKFIQALPGLGPTGIPVATPNTTKFPGTDFYKIVMGQFKQQLHPDLPGPATFWGYADVTNGQAPNHRYLGGAIVAQKGRPVLLRVQNSLPSKHPLPVDKTVAGAEPDQLENRASVHLHGGFTPWNSDGGPFAWFAPNGTHGPSFMNPGPVAGEADYYYTNDQSARLMWYHDHAMGITRLNAYAGLASAYILRDDVELALISNGVIPSREIPLILQDKTFISNARLRDPGQRGKVGDLFYPSIYEPAASGGRWDYGPDVFPPAVLPPGNETLPVPSCVPEFFADTPIVNGAAYPYVELEPRHYRFRMLNGSQARFYNLQLYYADLSGTEADLSKAGPRMIQIGTEGGFLPFPVALNNPPVPFDAKFDVNENFIPGSLKYNLLLAPAERADVIIDFSRVPVGAKLILYADAAAPFPGGDPLNDYTTPGYGPNTRTLMQIRVVARVGAADPPSMSLLESLAVNGGALFGTAVNNLLPAVQRLEARQAVRVRNLTLNEDFDEYGRLIQRLGTTKQNGVDNQGLPTWGRNYTDSATETPRAGDIEVWRIFNLTADTHPIHFHLVNVQVLSRQTFDAATQNFTRLGPVRLPDANELGTRETVRMNPGECTTVIMKFDLPNVPFVVPPSPRTGGNEYVWHCHILEHEEHDMMRPMIVI